MMEVVIVAIAATLVNLLMGWDSSTIAARIIDGVVIALAVTLTPLYISEVVPADIRGQLNTYSQNLGPLQATGLGANAILTVSRAGAAVLKVPLYKNLSTTGIQLEKRGAELSVGALCFGYYSWQ
ncbi:hypothetical protein JHK82_025037 [Glycine max]|nr:hypothetical protein JHK82_025037 [Glycine max]